MQIFDVGKAAGEERFQIPGIADIRVDPVIHPDRLLVDFDALLILLDAFLVNFDLLGIIFLCLLDQSGHIRFLNRLKGAVHRLLQRCQQIVCRVEHRIRGKTAERKCQHPD